MEWFWSWSWQSGMAWFVLLTALAALIVGSIALHKILNDEGSVPPRPAGSDDAFLVGSKEKGVRWSQSLVIPNQVSTVEGKSVTQAPNGINFLNPIGVGSSGRTLSNAVGDIFPENTLTNFGSVDHSPAVVDKTTGKFIVSTDTVLNTIALKSDKNSTAIVQLGGQLRLDTEGKSVIPRIVNFELETEVLTYGAINFALGQTSAPGSIVHFYCTMENGTIL